MLSRDQDSGFEEVLIGKGERKDERKFCETVVLA